MVLPVNEFGFVTTVNGIRESIIIGIPNTSDKGNEA